MKFDCITHSDTLRNPPRHYVDGRLVTSGGYWDTFDASVGSDGYRHSMIDRDEPGGQRSRTSTFHVARPRSRRISPVAAGRAGGTA